MKPRIIYAALAVLALSVPAVAQVFEARALPPDEILTILHMAGLDPIGQPKRSGANYVIRAIEGNDREVQVVIDANSGDILSKTSVSTASRIPPSNATRPHSRGGPMQPDRDRDGLDLSKLNIIVDEPGRDGALPPRRAAPTVSPKPVDRTAAVPPKPEPLPKPRPDAHIEAVPLPSRSPVESKRQPASLLMPPIPPRSGSPAPSKPNANTDERDRDGVSPPPERLPQRAAPTVSAKPVDRTAAVPPKPEPLSKPRPDANIEAVPLPSPPVVSTRRPAPIPLTPPILSNATPPLRGGTTQKESGNASAPSGRNIIMADPDDSVPPERFPQRHEVIE